MRLPLTLLLCGIPLTALAAPSEPLPPPTFTPLPKDQATEAPASPPPANQPSAEEPEVTIIKQTEQTIEEYRANGRLFMIKVTPKVGPPYYLIDQRGDGKFARQNTLDTGFRPPQWVIHRF